MLVLSTNDPLFVADTYRYGNLKFERVGNPALMARVFARCLLSLLSKRNCARSGDGAGRKRRNEEVIHFGLHLPVPAPVAPWFIVWILEQPSKQWTFQYNSLCCYEHFNFCSCRLQNRFLWKLEAWELQLLNAARPLDSNSEAKVRLKHKKI